MKGYFSQLARHTGLQFTDSRAKRQTVRPATPLHVEEVTLVQSTETVTNVPTDDRPITPKKSETAPAQTTNPSVSLSEIVPVETRVSLGNESTESAPIVRDTFTIEQHSQNVDVDQTASMPVYEADPVERVEVELAPHAPPTPAEITSQETKVGSAGVDLSDFDSSEPVERERMVRQYLREVQAWVAAGPTAEDNPAESESRDTAQSESVAFAVEREPLLPSAPSAPRDTIDVHDMNLSIGTINVVIEEPKPAAATVIAPTPAAPAPQPQTQHEPISLSRYYLRAW